MATRTLTQRRLEAIKPDTVRREYPDGLVPGLYYIVQPSGARSFAVRYRHAGKPAKLTLGSWPVLTLAKARELGRNAILAAKGGRHPGEEKKTARRKAEAAAANTLRAIAEEYLGRAKKLRTIGQRRATLERLIYPKLGDRPISEIKRSDIAQLLDQVEDERGARMADEVLAVVRKVMAWHTIRNDEFRSPIVRGMARTNKTERARTRILSDGELRAVWSAADTMPDSFGALVRFILVTATRRNEAAHMRRSELDGADWVIPAARYKGKHDHLIPLSPTAQAIIETVPRIDGSDWVFTATGKRPVTDFATKKRQFDKLCSVNGWTLHDLRRTSRSLMSRAGVTADIAERCLGHVIGGVRGVYDRHQYHAEKKHAFDALAALIERIVDPQDNVVSLHK